MAHLFEAHYVTARSDGAADNLATLRHRPAARPSGSAAEHTNELVVVLLAVVVVLVFIIIVSVAQSALY